MTYQGKLLSERRSFGRLRTVIRLETLEPRSLLAGLVNVPDCLLPAAIAQGDLVPAEVANIDAQLARSLRPQFNEPATDNERLGKLPRGVDEIKCDEDSEKSDSSEFWGSAVPAEPDAAPAPNQEAPLSTAPILDPQYFVTAIATSPSADQTRPPLTFVPQSVPTAAAPLSFHYFIKSPKPNDDHLFNLSSEPLAASAVRDTFVALTLLELPKPPHKPAAHNVVGESRFSNNVDRELPIESQTTERTDLIVNNHTHLVRNATAAIAQAATIVREADTYCAAMLSRNERPDHTLEVPLSPAIVTTSTVANHSPPSSAVGSQARNHWHFGLLSFVSMVLSFRSPAALVSHVGVKQRGLTSTVRRQRYRKAAGQKVKSSSRGK